MSPQNENTTPIPKAKELCTIRVMFPAESDEEAIAVKKKIKDALSDKPDVQMQFMIMDNFASGSQVR